MKIKKIGIHLSGKDNDNMKKSRLIAVTLACLLSVSFTSCTDDEKENSTVVVNSDSKDSQTESKSDDSKNDESKNDESKNGETKKDDDAGTEVTTVTLPEKDDDGSKITVVAVTDADNKPVTNAKGSEVTKVAIVDDKGNVITDSKGSEVAPNIKETKATTTKKPDRIVTTAATTAAKPEDTPQSSKNENASPKLDDGPTLTIPNDIEVAPGEEFTFKISVTGNAGYSSLIAWLDIEEKYFEFISFKAGDPDSSNYNRSPEKQNTTCKEYTKPGTTGLKTLLMLYFDASGENLSGDTTYATITLKAKEDVNPGKYELCFDTVADGETKAKATRVVPDGSQKNAAVLKPTYVNGSVTIK